METSVVEILQQYTKFTNKLNLPAVVHQLLAQLFKIEKNSYFSKQVGHRSIMDKASACGAKGRGIESRSFSFFYSKKPYHLLKFVLHDDLKHSYTQQRGPV